MRSGPRSRSQASRRSSGTTCATRSCREAARTTSRATRPSRVSVKATLGEPRAARTTTSPTWPLSVDVAFRNLRRAGTLKKRSLTSICVPAAQPVGFTSVGPPPSTVSAIPASCSRGRVEREKRETDAMLGSASPRKPNDAMRARSSSEAILLVACRSRASTASASSIPEPSSVTRIRATPPSSMSTRTRVAPASIAFSTSSLTTLAGRSTTSPAAIWLARSFGRRRTTDIPTQ